MITPNPSPVRPDLDRIEKRLNSIDPWEPGWDFVGMIEEDKTFAGYACRDIAALVAYARRLEAEVERLRESTNTMRENMNRQAIELGRANARATEYLAAMHRAASPGEEGRKE